MTSLQRLSVGVFALGLLTNLLWVGLKILLYCDDPNFSVYDAITDPCGDICPELGMKAQASAEAAPKERERLTDPAAGLYRAVGEYSNSLCVKWGENGKYALCTLRFLVVSVGGAAILGIVMLNVLGESEVIKRRPEVAEGDPLADVQDMHDTKIGPEFASAPHIKRRK